MRSPGQTPSIWRRLEALENSEFNFAVSRVTTVPKRQAISSSKGVECRLHNGLIVDIIRSVLELMHDVSMSSKARTGCV